MARSDLVDIEVTLITTTPKAYLVKADVGGKERVAKSVSEFAHAQQLPEHKWVYPCQGVLTVPSYVAEDAGLV